MAGTPQGEVLALVLALLSAFSHAVFGAINKGGMDPYINRGAINICYSLYALPFVIFVFPVPDWPLFQMLILSFLIHLIYEWLQAAAFSRGEFTLVYPIARGTGPLIIALLAIVVFDENLENSQWLGLIILSGSILSLAGLNLRGEHLRPQNLQLLKITIALALMAGISVAVYTTIDAYGIRLAQNPFSFLAWFFFMGGFGFPVVAYARWRRIVEKPPLGDLAMRGIFGALIALLSFGSLMLATRLGSVTEAAALRETSIIFATGIGVLFFREKVTLPRLLVIAMIACGAVMVEFKI